jgi:hypothetical protein
MNGIATPGSIRFPRQCAGLVGIILGTSDVPQILPPIESGDSNGAEQLLSVLSSDSLNGNVSPLNQVRIKNGHLKH